MITVPDFPAWICDMCGKREYDMQALNDLALLLFPPIPTPKITNQAKLSLRGKSAYPKNKGLLDRK